MRFIIFALMPFTLNILNPVIKLIIPKTALDIEKIFVLTFVNDFAFYQIFFLQHLSDKV